MMVEDRGKDEFSAQNLMKKHDALDAAVDDYSNNVRQLGEAARQLIAEGHPESEQISVRLAQVLTLQCASVVVCLSVFYFDKNIFV
jgi:spectrin beta